MFQDEYNKIEITNDKQVFKKEFGKTQKTEFSHQKENELPQGDLNEKYVGKTIKKVTQVNVEYTNKVPTHNAVVVEGATTATSVAAAATSVAVVASTVAVTAVAVATGISVALHDYQYNLNSFFISSNEVSYSLTLVDNNEEDEFEYEHYEDEPHRQDLLDEHIEEWPFILTVSNKNYEATRGLFYGRNEGEFYGLTLGDTYSIVLMENRYGGEVIFEESFTTYKNAIFRNFWVMGSADYVNRTFDVEAYYLDELDALSDFSIKMTDYGDESISYTLPIAKTNELQTVQVTDKSFDFSKHYKYTFSYKNNGDVYEFSSGEISFYDTSNGVSEVRGVAWDKRANFLNKTTEITLDYVDDYERFSDFKLVLTPNNSESIIYNLDPTTDPQIINLQKPNEEPIDLTERYSYMFTYMDSKEPIEQIIDSGIVVFEDNSGTITRFDEIIFDDANYLTNKFNVQLQYVNELEYYSGFELSLFQNSPSDNDAVTIPLNATTDAQPINASAYNLDLKKSYSYQLTCINNKTRETVTTGSVTFTDTSGYDGFAFTGESNYYDKYFVAQLSYSTLKHTFADFTLHLTNELLEDEIVIPLSGVVAEQHISTDNYDFDPRGSYSYTLDCLYDGERMVLDTGDVTFFDASGKKVEFKEFIFDGTADFVNRTFEVQLDFIDELNDLNDFKITLTDLDTDQTLEKTLDKVTTVQTIAVTTINGKDAEEEPIYPIDIVKHRMKLTFKYWNYNKYVDGYENSEFRFEDSLFADIDSTFDLNVDSTEEQYVLPIKFTYDQEALNDIEFSIYVYKGDEVAAYMFVQEGADFSKWQYVTMYFDGPTYTISDVVGSDDTKLVVCAWMAPDHNPDGETILLYQEKAVLTQDEKQDLLAAYIDYPYIHYGSDLGVLPIYNGNPEYFECTITFEAISGNTYTFNMYIMEQYTESTVNLLEPNEGPMDEDTFMEDFINNPMRIYITYCILTPNDPPIGDEPFTRSEEKILVLYDSFSFELSV